MKDFKKNSDPHIQQSVILSKVITKKNFCKLSLSQIIRLLLILDPSLLADIGHSLFEKTPIWNSYPATSIRTPVKPKVGQRAVADQC